MLVCSSPRFLQDTFSNLSLAVPSADGSPPSPPAANADDESTDEDDEAEPPPDGSSGSTVTKLLKELLKPEQLTGADQFHCDKCGTKRDAERGVRLRTMPPIVSIHLKRFAIHTATDRRGRSELSLVKVNTPVHFPRVLDLRSFVTPEQQQQAADAGGEGGSSSSSGEGGATASTLAGPPGDEESPAPDEQRPSPGIALQGEVEMRSIGVVPTGGQGGGGSEGGSGGGSGADTPSAEGDGQLPCAILRSGSLLYDLYAVLLHAGQLEKGHYFALIKDVEDGSWYRFDDEKVTLLTPEQLDRELRKAYGGRGSTSAYMLLYREIAASAAESDGCAEGGPSAHAGDDPAAAAFTSTL